MTFSVRPAQIEKDRDTLLSLLERNLRDLPHRKRFDWLYLENPAGQAKTWFVVAEETGIPVGLTSVFPKYLWINGKLSLCGQVGDFAVDVTHRSLGPAILLQKATFDAVDSGELACVYDCPPHDRGMAPFLRLHMKANTRMARYARPLRVDRYVEKKVGKGFHSYLLSTFGNIALRGTTAGRRVEHGIKISRLQHSFGQEFDRLDRRIGERGKIRARRCARDLNWRIRGDPLNEYHTLVARNSGELLGYVIYAVIDNDAKIIDLFGDLSGTTALELLDAVVRELRGSRIQTCQLFIEEQHSLAKMAREAHFEFRETSTRIVAYPQHGVVPLSTEGVESDWELTQLDLLA